MVNTVEQALEIVAHGKFPPLGKRGFNSHTRGNLYGGYDSAAAMMEAANQRTHLFAQIETMEAIQNLSEICTASGLSGIFVGPSDLSVDLGIPGKLQDSLLIDTAVSCVRSAREAGKRAGILGLPGTPLLDAVLDAGVDLVITGGDIANLRPVWCELTAKVKSRK